MISLYYDRICTTPDRRPRSPEPDQGPVIRAPRTGVMRPNIRMARRRAVALATGSGRMRFLALWSISFPVNMPDNIGYTCLNSWLTQMRKAHGLDRYLWVAERQGNGTLHYHVLVDRFMDVRAANAIMARSIAFYVDHGLLSWGNSSEDRYNGVDVSFISRRGGVRGRKERTRAIYRAVGYVTKYLSKDDTASPRRRWHCSRSVSELPIRTVIEPWDASMLVSAFRNEGGSLRFATFEYCSLAFGALFTCDMWSRFMYGSFHHEPPPSPPPPPPPPPFIDAFFQTSLL